MTLLPYYNWLLEEFIFSANDLLEQTSKAGMEASDTLKMKFLMIGGLIIGTRDGVNLEINE